MTLKKKPCVKMSAKALPCPNPVPNRLAWAPSFMRNCLRMNKRCCSIDPPAWTNAVQKEPATIFQLPLAATSNQALKRGGRHQWIGSSLSPPLQAGRQPRQPGRAEQIQRSGFRLVPSIPSNPLPLLLIASTQL